MDERSEAPRCYVLTVRTTTGETVQVEVVDILAALTPSCDIVADHFRCEAVAKHIRQGHPHARDTALRDAKAALAASQLNYEFLKRRVEGVPTNDLMDKANRSNEEPMVDGKLDDLAPFYDPPDPPDAAPRIEMRLTLEAANVVVLALRAHSVATAVPPEERELTLELLEELFNLLRPMGSACR
jgi:hypothetical protein